MLEYPWVKPCLKAARVTDALLFPTFLVISESTCICFMLAGPTGRFRFNLTYSTEQRPSGL